MYKFNPSAKEFISSPIPEELIKKKPGKANASYISGSTVIDYLNRSFDYLWSFEVVDQWITPSTAKFNPKYDKEPQPQGPVAHVKGRLTVIVQLEGAAPLHIVKEQFGSKAVIGGQMDQEHIFKSAGTDALKKCASLLGVGLELYRDENEQAFFDDMNMEDPWTDEALEKFAGERKKIQDFMAEYELDADGIAQYVDAAFEVEGWDISMITPDNIVEFVSYLEEIQTSEE